MKSKLLFVLSLLAARLSGSVVTGTFTEGIVSGFGLPAKCVLTVSWSYDTVTFTWTGTCVAYSQGGTANTSYAVSCAVGSGVYRIGSPVYNLMGPTTVVIPVGYRPSDGHTTFYVTAVENQNGGGWISAAGAQQTFGLDGSINKVTLGFNNTSQFFEQWVLKQGTWQQTLNIAPGRSIFTINVPSSAQCTLTELVYGLSVDANGNTVVTGRNSDVWTGTAQFLNPTFTPNTSAPQTNVPETLPISSLSPNAGSAGSVAPTFTQAWSSTTSGSAGLDVQTFKEGVAYQVNASLANTQQVAGSMAQVSSSLGQIAAELSNGTGSGTAAWTVVDVASVRGSLADIDSNTMVPIGETEYDTTGLSGVGSAFQHSAGDIPQPQTFLPGAPTGVGDGLDAVTSVSFLIPFSSINHRLTDYTVTVDLGSEPLHTPCMIFRGICAGVLVLGFWFASVAAIKGAFAGK